MENKNTFQILSDVDVSQMTETKNKFTYLSWSKAWHEVKVKFPKASYEVVQYDNRPYLVDEHLGYMVCTNVTINDETLPMHLPVMDFRNQAVKVGKATITDVNKAIMRCLVKNLAMFGLGLNIYAGEDLPMQEPSAQTQSKATKANIKTVDPQILNKIAESLADCKDMDELKVLGGKWKNQIAQFTSIKLMFTKKKEEYAA